MTHDPLELRKRLGRTAIILICVVGTALSAAGALLQRHWERQQVKFGFKEISGAHIRELRESIAHAEDQVRALAAFFRASTVVNQREFLIFAQSSLRRFPGIQALEWAPRVSGERRAAYEAEARREFPNFQITERDGEGNLVTAAPRAEYFPVFFLEPYKGNEESLGFDLWSNRERRDTLEQARDNAALTATGRLTLVQGDGEETHTYGFLIVKPVYEQGVVPRSVEDRRRLLTGFAAGVFHIPQLVDSALARYGRTGVVDLELLDQSNPDPASRYLYRYGKASAANPDAVAVGDLRYSAFLAVAGRTWLVRVAPGPNFKAAATPWPPWLTFATGLLFTVLLVAYLEQLRSRTEQVARLVDLRTRELSMSRRTLEHETQERRRLQGQSDRFFSLQLDLLCIAGFDGFFKRINPAWQRTLGYTQDEFLSRPFIEFVHPDDREATIAETGKLAIGAETVNFENRYLTQDGGYKWLLWSATADVAQRLFYGVAHDITETKRANTALLESESRMRAIFDNVVDGIITANEHGIIQTVNRATEKIFGYEADELIGHNLTMLMPEPDRSEHDAFLRRYLETGVATIIGGWREVAARRKNGEIFLVELAVSDIVLEGRTHLFTGIVRDITERKRVERMKNEFISTVSHELRTPLTSIRGALGLLTGGAVAALPEHVQNLLEIAAKNSDRLVRLINDILDVEKIESGKMQFDMKPLDVSELIEHAVESNQVYADQFWVSLKVTRTEPGCRVFADEDRLTQVLTNLISNAVKFSPPGETVEIGAEVRDGFVRISVRDRGPGIPASYRDRVFEKFSQADSSDTRSKGGTGLGLSISKAIVDQLGGTIAFDSSAGNGCHFHVDLPVLASESLSPRGDASRDRRLILVCEDDPDIATLLRLMLEKQGFAADVARTAGSAKALLATQSYAAMTLDILLPDQSGVDFYREIRKNERTRNLPVIVVSAVMEPEREEIIGDALSVIDWITKPIDEERLLAAVSQAVDGDGEVSRILHVEDDPDILRIVRAVLQDSAQITPATTVADAAEKLHTLHFDLVILDIGLPDGSGLSLLPLLSHGERPIPVVVFSAEEVDRQMARNVAAQLVKSKTTNEKLMHTIRALINGTRRRP